MTMDSNASPLQLECLVNPDELRRRSQQIELLLLDVDGVLTDGTIVYSDNEVETKAFHVRDGSALKIWSLEEKQAGIITGRQSPVIARRAAELDITWVYQKVKDKEVALNEILTKTKLSLDQVCFIGDDIPDLSILNRVGLAVAVADACSDVLERVHYRTNAFGGRGAVREVVELVLRNQNRWQKWVDKYWKAT